VRPGENAPTGRSRRGRSRKGMIKADGSEELMVCSLGCVGALHASNLTPPCRHRRDERSACCDKRCPFQELRYGDDDGWARRRMSRSRNRNGRFLELVRSLKKSVSGLGTKHALWIDHERSYLCSYAGFSCGRFFFPSFICRCEGFRHGIEVGIGRRRALA